MPNKNHGRASVTAAIYALFFFFPTYSSVSAALADIGFAYPAIDASTLGYIVTISSLFQAIVCLPVGALAGKKVKFRTLILFASILYTVSGLFPFFLADGQSFAAFLVSRALLGVATGIMMPLCNALVMLLFDDEQERARKIGIGNMFFSIGVVSTSFIGGILCTISWQSTFLIYALGVLLIALTFVFLKEPDLSNETEDEQSSKVRLFDALPLLGFALVILFCVCCVCNQNLIVYCAEYISASGMGDSVLAGTMVSIMFISSGVSSALFGKVYALLKNKTFPVTVGVSIAALILCHVASQPDIANPILFGIGIVLIGFGFMTVTCYATVAISELAKPDAVGTAMGFTSLAIGLGDFAVSPFTQIASWALGGTMNGVLLVCACTLAVVLVLVLLVQRSLYSNKKKGSEAN